MSDDSFYKLYEARTNLLLAALRAIRSQIDDEPHAHSDAEAEYAEDMLAIAARDLVRAINHRPEHARPIGWAEPGDTATRVADEIRALDDGMPEWTS